MRTPARATACARSLPAVRALPSCEPSHGRAAEPSMSSPCRSCPTPLLRTSPPPSPPGWRLLQAHPPAPAELERTCRPTWQRTTGARRLRDDAPIRDRLAGTCPCSLRVHRGRVREADDRTLAGLQPSDRLSPRLATCVVQQREALVLQLVRSDPDGVSVRGLEIDPRLRHRPLHWPVRRAEARPCSLGQGPDPEGLAPLDVFAVQIAVTFGGQRQAKRVYVEPAADARVRGDHRDAGDELHVHDVTFRH